MNDAEKLRRHERLSNAFSDLESPVCDIRNMSMLLEMAVEKSTARGDRDADGNVTLVMSNDEHECLNFAVFQLGSMIRDFHHAFYEKLEFRKDTPIVAPCRVPSNQTQ